MPLHFLFVLVFFSYFSGKFLHFYLGLASDQDPPACVGGPTCIDGMTRTYYHAWLIG
jgi:hypothetical protein